MAATFTLKLYIQSNTGEVTELGNLTYDYLVSGFKSFIGSYTPPAGTTSCVLFLQAKSSSPVPNNASIYLDNIQIQYDTKNNELPVPWHPGNADLSYIRLLPRTFATLGAASGIVSEDEMFYVVNSGLYVGTEIPGQFFSIRYGIMENEGEMY